MNVEFIQNLIDELEITTSGNSSNINIKNGGTGFAVGDYLIVYNDDLGTVPALTTTTTTADAAQTGKDGDNPGYLRVSAVSGTITSTGATIVFEGATDDSNETTIAITAAITIIGPLSVLYVSSTWPTIRPSIIGIMAITNPTIMYFFTFGLVFMFKNWFCYDLN